jgi:UDP-2-acetamido-2,6-beta-L-arabino-hexul-4-ose reductase
MKTVLVTGAKGFVGRNLCTELGLRNDVTLIEYDIDSTPADLEQGLASADVIVHLAGVNRPQHIEEFQTGNSDFTAAICGRLRELKRSPLFVLSSSIQAALDNPYGVSKLLAEEAVQRFAADSGTSYCIYRLPNVFGKGCRPNYNSAVATFCHNIARGLDIVVNDPNVDMKLVYIDDVVEEFVRAIDGDSTVEGGYCRVPTVHEVKLGRIVELLKSFCGGRTDLQVPDQSDPFAKKLYATYLSYLPEDRFSYPLKMNVDQRGSFTEFLKTSEHGQVSINVSKPRITKGNHWHRTKNEKFLVVSGQGVIRFRKLGEAEIIEYFVNGDKLEVVDIPPGYTHNIENLGDTDMVTVMWANEAFDPKRPDTVYEVV